MTYTYYLYSNSKLNLSKELIEEVDIIDFWHMLCFISGFIASSSIFIIRNYSFSATAMGKYPYAHGMDTF